MAITRGYWSGLIVGALMFGLPAGALAGEDRAHDHEGKGYHQADQYYDPAQMAAARHALHHHHGGQSASMIMLERFEVQSGDGHDTGLWDLQAYYGGDMNRLWLKSEGHYDFDEQDLEGADVQALWSRSISTFFDLQAGLRYELEPKGRTHAVLGLQGLAPYWFEIDGAVYLSDKGDLTGAFEVEYDWFFTQRLVLQPRLEVKFSAQDIKASGTGAGLSEMELGARLRYDIRREFAPYIGLEWQGTLGETENFAKAAGEDTDRLALIAGVRLWY